LFLLPLGYVTPAWYDLLGLAAAGAGNGIAQFWWTRSLSMAPPSAVVPFNYLSLIWATILGFAIWGDVPTPDLFLGSAIVVASGLYILWRETMRRRKPAPSGAVGLSAKAGVEPEAGSGRPLSRE
jgi:drug/metabolite transporter (DMT)-like permease